MYIKTAFGPHATNIKTKNYVVKLFKWSNVPKQNSSNYGFIEHQEAFQIIPNYFLFHLHLSNRDLPVAVSLFWFSTQPTPLSEMF